MGLFCQFDVSDLYWWYCSVAFRTYFTWEKKGNKIFTMTRKTGRNSKLTLVESLSSTSTIRMKQVCCLFWNNDPPSSLLFVLLSKAQGSSSRIGGGHQTWNCFVAACRCSSFQQCKIHWHVRCSTHSTGERARNQKSHCLRAQAGNFDVPCSFVCRTLRGSLV